MTRSPPRLTRDEAESLAVRALSFLADRPDSLGRFLADTGLGPDNLRAAAASPRFLASVLDYFAANEDLWIALAADVGIDPALLPRARAMLAQPGDR